MRVYQHQNFTEAACLDHASDSNLVLDQQSYRGDLFFANLVKQDPGRAGRQAAQGHPKIDHIPEKTIYPIPDRAVIL